MKKYISLCLALILLLSFAGCTEDAVSEISRTYPITSEITSLEIQVGAADLTIKTAETLSVESNIKRLSVTENSGVLSIIDETKRSSSYTNPILTLYLPEDLAFEHIHISTGAAKLTSKALTTKSITLQLGAGDVHLTSLNVSDHADITGGAGEITIDTGTIHNLKLEMGVGELNLTSTLMGNNELTFGVGESNLTLIGNPDRYTIDIEKGLGSITVDDHTMQDFERRGPNIVQIHGGVGSVNLKFQNKQ